MELWQLQQLQGLPLEVKIRKTQERIKEWYEHWDGQVYVSFSGGKDSTVLLHIVRQMYPDVEAVFVDTGLEYPEIRKFVKTFDNVTWLRPKMNFKQVIEKYGYPVISKEQSLFIYQAQQPITEKNKVSHRLRREGIRGDGTKASCGKISDKWLYLIDAPFKISNQCCDVMKKRPAHEFQHKSGKQPMTAQTTAESRIRKIKWLQNGCNAFDSRNPISNPMSFWEEQDILHYIKDFNIPYCSVYGEIIPSEQIEGQITLEGTYQNLKTTGCQRTGCMFCMFGVHLEKEPNRFQMMRETHPKQYDYCINKLGLGEVLDYIGVKY